MKEIKFYFLCILFFVQIPFVFIIVELEYFFFPPVRLKWFPIAVIRRVPDGILHPLRWEFRQRDRLIQLQYKIRARLESYYHNYHPPFTTK